MYTHFIFPKMNILLILNEFLVKFRSGEEIKPFSYFNVRHIIHIGL